MCWRVLSPIRRPVSKNTKELIEPLGGKVQGFFIYLLLSLPTNLHPMNVKWLTLFFFLACWPALAQIRLPKLELVPKQQYVVEFSDILVIDTLVMADSSAIVFLTEKADNFIHCKMLSAGKGARIIATGENGTAGKEGNAGGNGAGPCKDGLTGKAGTGGSHGADGHNLSVYTNSFQINGVLTFDLRGGDGGRGGNGGEGGAGSAGTSVCSGGNGGTGGDGGSGGNGGNGGTLTLTCPTCRDLRVQLNQTLMVKTLGGKGGDGGQGGAGGAAGLNYASGSGREGTRGGKGKNGVSGKAGEAGAIKFESD